MRALCAWDKGRYIVVELGKSRSPFGIKGKGDDHSVGVGPCSSFDRQQALVDGSQDFGFGHVVVSSKGQQRGELPGEWTSGALACFWDTTPARCILPGLQVAEQAFESLNALFQRGNAAL